MSSYNALEVEKKWHQNWKDMKLYTFDKDRKPIYSIDNPPRYASGGLHIGHAVHYTHIDFIARFKRMNGFNVLFPLCFDVNGIPIEERVERLHGITRLDINRHDFTKLCKKFADDNIDEMIRQFMILGESMDDSVYYRTDAEYYRRLTQISFIRLFKKGYVYKGNFPVNWCPRCMTAMADAEIEHTNRHTKLNTLKFYCNFDEQSGDLLSDEKGAYIEIATTRPEMLSSCQLVAIHPKDNRASFLVGKEVIVPIYKKKVPIIADETVDPSFGTGVVMICTIGDKDDLDWALKYELPFDISISEEGTMNELAGRYEGMKIEDARKAIIHDLNQLKLLTKQEDLEQSVGICWRCKTPAEFIQAKQWFLKILPFKDDVLATAKTMKWFPKYMFKRLEEWVTSLRWDWVISRQRYFATPIPLWECEKCGDVVLAEENQCYIDPTIDSPSVEKCGSCGGALIGSPDVFDTWMDSSISPLYNSFWERDNKLFEKIYPVSLRPQAHDIIRTWAFYTILRCYLLTEKPVFEEVMIDGFILAPDGKPMHTSLGNVVDPLDIIKEHGSDALRYYAASCKLGEDNPFRFQDLVRGIRLMNKLWNIERFISTLLSKKPQEASLNLSDRWILSLYSNVVKKATDAFNRFEYANAMREIEYFMWHEFADHYIEMVKHRIYENEDDGALFTLYTIGLGLVKLLAPFLPFITEEIYQENYKQYEQVKSIHHADWPEPLLDDISAIADGCVLRDVIAKVREYKSAKGVALNAPMEKIIFFSAIEGTDIIANTLNVKAIEVVDEKPEVEQMALPIYSVIGPQFKDKSNAVADAIKKESKDVAKHILKNGKYDLSLDGLNEPITITSEFVEIHEETAENLLKANDIVLMVEL